MTSSATIAGLQIKGWEQILSVRITLQRALDLTNRLPYPEDFNLLSSTDEYMKSNQESLINTLGSLTDDMICLLESSQTRPDVAIIKKKRKRDLNPSWERLSEVVKKLKPNWQAVVNIHHARLHFGSEQSKSQLKVFNHTIWDQTEALLSDPVKVIQKSRLPRVDLPKRLFEASSMKESDKNTSGDNDAGNLSEKSLNEYDWETYDDRVFYAMLLKSFVASGSVERQGGGSQTEFQAALRNHKLKSTSASVDRRASKGRKIRYIVHKKLENFMFSMPPTTASSLDVPRLFASLFQ